MMRNLITDLQIIRRSDLCVLMATLMLVIILWPSQATAGPLCFQFEGAGATTVVTFNFNDRHGHTRSGLP